MVYYKDVTGNRRIVLSNLGANLKCFELFFFLLSCCQLLAYESKMNNNIINPPPFFLEGKGEEVED